MRPLGLHLGMSKAAGAKPYKARLEYIESSGTQYIDLPFGFDNTDEVITAFGIDVILTNDKFMICTKQWNTNNNRFAMGGGSMYQCGYGSAQTGGTHLSPDTRQDGIVRVWHYANYRFSVPSLSISLNCSSISWGGTTSDVRLFYGYNSPSRGKITSYDHYKNAALICSLIPVLDHNNTPCMYDEVSGEFFYNQGTGEFIAGPRV